MAYPKQTWDTTSYVTPTRMNNIEDGIYNNSVLSEKATKSVTSSTISALFDSIYSDLNALGEQALADGYFKYDGLIYKLSRVSVGQYTFTSNYTQSSGNLRFFIANIQSSGSKLERYTVTTGGSISYNDLSNDTITDSAYFYGRG